MSSSQFDRSSIDPTVKSQVSTDDKSGGSEQQQDKDVKRLLDHLDKDEMRAWEKYDWLHQRLMRIFDWKKCSDSDVLAAEALRRLGKKLATEQVNDLVAFAISIVKNMCLEAYRDQRRFVSVDELQHEISDLRDTRDYESRLISNIDKEMWLRRLRECLDLMDPSERRFVVAYYSAELEKDKHHRQRLAVDADLTSGALRTRVNRSRNELERCILRKLGLFGVRTKFSIE